MSLKQGYFLWCALKTKNYDIKRSYFFALDVRHARRFAAKEKNPDYLKHLACDKKRPHSHLAVLGLAKYPEMLVEIARVAQTQEARTRAALSLSCNYPELLPKALIRNPHRKTKDYIMSLLSFDQLETVMRNKWNINIFLDEPLHFANQTSAPDELRSPSNDEPSKPEELHSSANIDDIAEDHAHSRTSNSTLNDAPEKVDVLKDLRLPRGNMYLEKARQTDLIAIARSTTDVNVGLEVVELLRNNPNALMRIASTASGKTALLEVRKAAVDTIPPEFSLRQELAKMSEKMLSVLGNSKELFNIRSQDERAMIEYIDGLSKS